MLVCGGPLPLTLRVGQLMVAIAGCALSNGSVHVVVVSRARETPWAICWPRWNFVFDELYAPTDRLIHISGFQPSESHSREHQVHVHDQLSMRVNGHACGSVFRLLHASRTHCQLPWDADQPIGALVLTLAAGTAEHHQALPLEPFHAGHPTSMQCTATPLFGHPLAYIQGVRQARVAWNALGFGVSVVFVRTAGECVPLAAVPGVVCQVRAHLSGPGRIPAAEHGGARLPQNLTAWSDQGIYTQLCIVYATAWDSELLALTDIDEIPMQSLAPVFDGLRAITDHAYAGIRIFFDADKNCPIESGLGDDLAADGVTAGRAFAVGLPAIAQGAAGTPITTLAPAAGAPITTLAPRAGAGEAGFCPRSTDDWMLRCINRGLQFYGVEAIVPSPGCFAQGQNTTAAPCVPWSAVPWGNGYKRTHFKWVVVPSRIWDGSVHHFWPKPGFSEPHAIFSPCLQHIRQGAGGERRRANQSRWAVARPVIAGEEAGRPAVCDRWCLKMHKMLWSRKCLRRGECDGCRPCQRAQHAAKEAYFRLAAMAPASRDNSRVPAPFRSGPYSQ